MNRRIVLGLLAWLIGLGGVPFTQHGCVGTTGSKRFAFEARIGGTLGLPKGFTFTNETGWTIALTKADMTVGPVYLNVIPPLRDTSQGWLGPFLDGFAIKEAWAVPGSNHLGPGRIVGEVLRQITFNALSSDLVSFQVAGSMAEETVRTAEVWFYPKPGVSPETTKIDTIALDVAGEAVRQSERVRFRGALVLDDAWQPNAQAGTRGNLSIAAIRKVRGIGTTFFPEEGGHLEIRVDVTRLFRGADFANLEDNPSDRDGTKILVQAKTGTVTTDQVMTNLYQGLHETTATYAVRWIQPSL